MLYMEVIYVYLYTVYLYILKAILFCIEKWEEKFQNVQIYKTEFNHADFIDKNSVQ